MAANAARYGPLVPVRQDSVRTAALNGGPNKDDTGALGSEGKGCLGARPPGGVVLCGPQGHELM